MHIKSNQTQIELKKIETKDLPELWNIAYNTDLKWTQYDGPYYGTPIYEKNNFIENIGPKDYVSKELKFAIIDEEKIIGIVNANFEDGKLRKWLEIGIRIYDSNKWNKGIGFQAIKLFTSYLFDLFDDIRRIGFTTWSGNKGMIQLGVKLGYSKEAQIRQVRYWQDKYWDSIKYGVLRDEWTPIQYYIEQ